MMGPAVIYGDSRHDEICVRPVSGGSFQHDVSMTSLSLPRRRKGEEGEECEECEDGNRVQVPSSSPTRTLSQRKGRRLLRTVEF
jgi:hypothetical protein